MRDEVVSWRMKVSRDAFRKPRNYGLAVASEAVRPALRGLARTAVRKPASDPTTWRRGLIIGHSHVGDVLYRTCSLQALHAGLPDCRWDYLTSPSSAAVLEGNPAIASVRPFVVGEDSWSLARGGFRALRREGYDVILCTNTHRHLPDLALALALGAPNRIAFGNKGYSGLLTFPVNLDVARPYPEYFRAMVGAVLGVKPEWPLRTRVFPNAADRAAAARCWASLALDSSRPVIACAPMTRQASGVWPPSFFANVLSQLLMRQPVNVVLFGAANDEPDLRRIAAALPVDARVVAGQLGWLPFACALEKCDALLAMDSGPRHLANAVATPVAFTRNLMFARIEAGTYSDNEIDLAPPDAEYVSPSEVPKVVQSVSVQASAELLLGLIGRPSRVS